jgi:hypothetical protein
MWRWATGRSQGTRRPGVGKRSSSTGRCSVDFDYELAEAALKHPPREPAYRLGRLHSDFLITLRSLGVHTDRDSIEQAALAASRRVFGEVKVLHPLTTSLRQTRDAVNALAARPERLASCAARGRASANVKAGGEE